METFYIDRYQIDINITPETKAGDYVTGYIKMRNIDGCPEAEKEKAHFVFGYSVYKLVDDTAADLAKRIFVHYKMGKEPETKRPVEESMSAAQIRGSIAVNEQSWEQASKTLREILDETKPRREYHLERMISALNLCSDIAKDRARLEFELKKAIQSGR